MPLETQDREKKEPVHEAIETQERKEEKCEPPKLHVEVKVNKPRQKRRAGELLVDDLSTYYKPSTRRQKNE